VGIVPPAVAPDFLAGDALGAIAAFLVDPAHGGVGGVALDPVESQLFKSESRASANGVGRVAPAPGFFFADQQAAERASCRPADLVQSGEADVRAVLGQDRPVQVGVAPGREPLERLLPRAG
jgi:hypothetical protein